MIHIIAAAGLLEVESVRWIERFSDRTGSVTMPALTQWLESPENPLIFVGQGVWMARLLVAADEANVRRIAIRRDGELDFDPLARVPRVPSGITLADGLVIGAPGPRP